MFGCHSLAWGVFGLRKKPVIPRLQKKFPFRLILSYYLGGGGIWWQVERDEVYRIVAVTTVLVGGWSRKVQDRNATCWCLIFCIEIVFCVCVCVCVIEQRFGFRLYCYVYLPYMHLESYVYWTVHHLDSWIKRDQLEVTCFIISLFNAQHVSDVNTSILRSLRLICWVISWVLLLWFDVLRCGLAEVVWYPDAGRTRAIQPMK